MPVADMYLSFTGKAQQLAITGHLKKGQYAKLRNQVRSSQCRNECLTSA